MQTFIWWNLGGYSMLWWIWGRKVSHSQRLGKIYAFKKCHRITVTILIIQGSFDVNETNTHKGRDTVFWGRGKKGPGKVQDLLSPYQGLSTWVVFLFYPALPSPSSVLFPSTSLPIYLNFQNWLPGPAPQSQCSCWDNFFSRYSCHLLLLTGCQLCLFRAEDLRLNWLTTAVFILQVGVIF